MLNTLVLHNTYVRYTTSPLAQKNVLEQAQAQTALAQNVVSDNFNGYLPKPGKSIADDFSGFLPETK